MGDLPDINALRDIESGDRVHGRIEISRSGFRGADAGLDVMGDGALVAYLGVVRKRELEPEQGEDVYDALRSALAG